MIATATVTLKDTGNYSGGPFTKTFTIKQKSSDTLTINDISAVTYNGNSQEPAVKILDGTTELKLGTDYTVKYSSNQDVGTASAEITFNGNYTGEVTKNFKINPKSSETLTIDNISAVTYDGNAHTPTLTIKDGNKTLDKDTNFTVEYPDNINAGTASAKITFKNNYSGEVTKKFTINPKSSDALAVDEISSVTYNGKTHTPTVTVNDSKKHLLRTPTTLLNILII